MSGKVEFHRKLKDIGYEVGPFASKETLANVMRLHSEVSVKQSIVSRRQSDSRLGSGNERYQRGQIERSRSTQESDGEWTDRWTCDRYDGGAQQEHLFNHLSSPRSHSSNLPTEITGDFNEQDQRR